MRKYLMRSFLGGLIGLLSFALAAPATAQTIDVTFRVNMATNPDTLKPGHFVQIRGALNGQTGPVLPDGKVIDWSSASEIVLEPVGGDYWQYTIRMAPDDTLFYKYWTGIDSETGTFHNGGWESDIASADGIETNNRTFISGDMDTTLSLEYYNGTGSEQPQFWRPFEEKEDSLAVYFRVNMAGVTELDLFDPEANGPVGVRGDDQASGGVLNWGTTNVLLERETNSVMDGSFWSGVAHIPADSVTAGSVQNYKFFVEDNGGIDWEGDIPNRQFTYTASLIGRTDTTLHWDHFNKQAPTGQTLVESQVTFRVSTEALEGIGLFDRGLGDEIAVIGAKGWDVPSDFIELNFVAALQEWATTEIFTSIPGTEIPYKYFIRWDSSRVDAASPNYIPALESLSNGWEEPAVTGGGNRIFVFEDAAQQAPPGDFGFDRQFFNSVPANGFFTNDVAVTFNVNMAPAADPASNTDRLFDPSTDSVFVQMDGSLLAVAQGYAIGGADARVVKLADSDQDMVYSGAWNIQGPGWYQLPYVIAYGNDTDGYITNGGGFDKGRRYYQFIHPTKVNDDLSTEWPSEFNLPTVDWLEGPPSAPLTVEDPPDLTKPTSVADNEGGVPLTFELEQNYPNPFNPQTTINYQVANDAHVKIEIYNLMGQLVKTLVDKKQARGSYSITWSGDNQTGAQVSSGVYFLKMRAGDFARVRKMALIR